VRAGDLPTEPMLRIDAQGHIGEIRGIAIDSGDRFAVTASSDKTVRVWSLPDGKLQRTIWLPSEDGDEGKANAVALSPDGAIIAVGGQTGPPGDHNIYLFDRATGALTRRLSGLPSDTQHLAYSSDGRRLAAALGNGVRVFDVGDGYRPLPYDSGYGNMSRWVDFDGNGRLVSASDDGFVRLYAPGHYDKPVVPKTRVKGVGRPSSVAFSPDGRHIAVGDYESSTVAVLRSSDLTPEVFPIINDFDETFLVVAWSKDGEQLFAGGYHTSWKHADRLARRWDNEGSGAFVDIPGALDIVMQLVPGDSRAMLFADGAGFGLIGSAGRAKRLQRNGSIDLREADSDTIAVNPDTRAVQVADYISHHVIRFDLARRAVTLDPNPDAALSKPITKSPRIELTQWKNSFSPMLNGVKLALLNDELSRSLALVPGTEKFVLGASWSLRLFDSNGKQIWSRPVPGAVWGVNVSSNGKMIVAAYDDGTIRWHRADNGTELLALFIHPDGQRWIAWTPQGYYDASAGADDLIGWQVNHGYDQAPDFFPVSQFQQRFNRRDVIARVLDTLDVDKALADANKAAGAPVAKAVSLTTSALTPVVEIKDPAAVSEQTRSLSE
jgi:WD40 repeat protein